MPAGSGQENPTMTATNPTATTKPAAPQKPAIDPETVTLSGYVIDERYAPGSVQTTDSADPSMPHARKSCPINRAATRTISDLRASGRAS